MIVEPPSAEVLPFGEQSKYPCYMTDDEERWAEALAIKRRYGADAVMHIAERILDLSKAGDTDGVDRWRQIAARYDRLLSGTMQ